MSAREEPAYLMGARLVVRRNENASPIVVRELVARIDRDAAALKAAQPLSLKPGLYRNALGAEVHVTALRPDRNFIGAMWDAEQRHELFGTRYLLVTPQGMHECGYTFVEARA